MNYWVYKYNLFDSNVFYFEIHVDTFVFRQPCFEETLKVGFIEANADVVCFEKDVLFGIDFFNNYLIFKKGFHILEEFKTIFKQ